MFRSMIARTLLSMTLLFGLTSGRVAADTPADVEQVLRDIRQDRPVPTLAYLHQSASINADCASYQGTYHAIDITVETHPNSARVASLLLQIPGADQTKQILPAVSRVLGPPHASDPKHSAYGWDWPKYRAVSMHYAPSSSPHAGFTVVSLFYR